MMRSSKFLNTTTAAYATTSINQILIQIITVPIFILKTDLETFAAWLIAYNFALLTTVLDFGQVTASQNSFRKLALQNMKHQILERTKYLNTFTAITYASYFVVLCTISDLLPKNLSMLLCGIFVYLNLLQTIFGVFEAQTRANGTPTLGIYSSNILRLSEFLGVLVGLLLFSDSLPSIAICAALSKTFVFLAILLRQRKHYSVITFGISSRSCFCLSIKEGTPFLLNKISDWLIVSGVVIAIESKISSFELVLFVASRTFFRLGWQLSSIISSSHSIKMTSAWAEDKINEFNKLRIRNLKITLIISLIGSVFYLTIGKTLFEYWTRNNLQLDPDLLHIGLTYSLVLSISHAQKSTFNSINRNLLNSIISLISATLVNLTIWYSQVAQSLGDVYILLVIVEFISMVSILLLGRRTLQKYQDKSF